MIRKQAPLRDLRRRIITLLLAAPCAGCAPAAQDVQATGAGRDGTHPLAPFFQALKQRERGQTSRVAVLQLGDSHTANDAFSGRLRELMQARFGDGGRGMLPPGVPYRYYRPAQVSVTADGWRVAGSNGNSLAAGPFGLAGLRQVTTGPATMTLTADPGGLAHVTIELLTQPGGGSVTISDNTGDSETVSTAASAVAVQTIIAPTNPAATAIEVHAAGDGPAALLGWTVERAAPGVTWSNLGTVGATVDLVLRWDPATMAAEIRALAPAMIVLAFGTNEGFRDSTDLMLYRTQVQAVLGALRRATPDAAIAVAGPPGGVRPAGAGPGTACADRRYAVPANLPPVRSILREEAARAGLFYWDWAAAMGGDCAMAEWAERDPPWAARDHVHLLLPGARATAEALFNTLMAGYAQAPP